MTAFPSATARRVAVQRLGFARLPAPYGDPAADEALARDVAGIDPASPGAVAGPASHPEPDVGGSEGSEGMVRLLRARTSFFDRVVTRALERGVAQVVVVGAGYDGRSLRYAKPGVRWWEVDHPDTQTDKRERLSRLGLPSDHVVFVPWDLRQVGLADTLVGQGLEPDATTVILLEGVAVYLDVPVLASVLGELRSVATVGTRLAISLSRRRSTPEAAARRARFAAAVAAVGEEARNDVDPASAAALFQAARWRTVDIAERAQAAGLVMVAPVWTPAAAATGVTGPAGAAGPAGPAGAAGVTKSVVGRYMETMLHRTGDATLAAHLAEVYGATITRVAPLDVGTHRVELAGGERWVARVFPATRDPAAAEEDARLLDWVAGLGVPVEEPVAQPVSVHQGQPVLVTRFAPGRTAGAKPEVFRVLGQALGRLHAATATSTDGPAETRRSGGAWHHLVLDAPLQAERLAIQELLAASGKRVGPGDADRYQVLVDDLAQLASLDDLPEAFGHPDLVPRNLVRQGPDVMTVIDWAGAGRYLRVAALGCLLWSTGGSTRNMEAALAGYHEAAALSDAEGAALERAMWIRPLVLACWTFATGRSSLVDSVAWWERERSTIATSAERVRQVLQT